MSMERKYKVGDRIFYDVYEGIRSDIIIEISDKFYINDKGKKVEYQWLTVEKSKNFSRSIESYNCISPSNPRCKELAKQYAKFDKQKDAVIESMMGIISQFDKNIQKDILKLLETKINGI